jgi:hypothetical protein
MAAKGFVCEADQQKMFRGYEISKSNFIICATLRSKSYLLISANLKISNILMWNLRVLTMVCNTQKHCACERFSSPGILNNQKTKRFANSGESRGWLILKGHNRIDVSLSSPQDGNIQFPERCFLDIEFRMLDKFQIPSF